MGQCDLDPRLVSLEVRCGWYVTDPLFLPIDQPHAERTCCPRGKRLVNWSTPRLMQFFVKLTNMSPHTILRAALVNWANQVKRKQ
jgi:hypothetical protein